MRLRINRKKLLASILAISMMVSIMPVGAFASTGITADTAQEVQNSVGKTVLNKTINTGSFLSLFGNDTEQLTEDDADADLTEAATGETPAAVSTEEARLANDEADETAVSAEGTSDESAVLEGEASDGLTLQSTTRTIQNPPRYTDEKDNTYSYNGTVYKGTGTTANLFDQGCKYKPVEVTGFNADVIAEGSIFDRDPKGSSSTQAQATTTMSLEPENFSIQTVFVANGFRGRADTATNLPFSNVKYNEALQMLPDDGKLIYMLDGAAGTNTYFQLQPYCGTNNESNPNAFAIKQGEPAAATTAEVKLKNPAGYKKLHLLLSGVPVHMNTFKIEFVDGSSVTVNGGFDFGGSAQFETNGNKDGKSVPFDLAARSAFTGGNMTKTKASFSDKSAAITKKSDEKIDPQKEAVYYHYMTGKVVDLTNITYTEDGKSKTGDLSKRPIKELIFADPDFTAGSYVDYRAGFLFAVSGEASPKLAAPVWSDSNASSYYIDLSWLDVSGETKYVLEAATDANFENYIPGFQAKELPAGTVTAKLTGLTPSTTYFCRVTAYNGELPGTPSAVKTVASAGENGAYHVIYNLNGVSATAVTDSKKYFNGDDAEVLDGLSGTYIRTSDSNPVKFVTWNTQSDGKGTKYQAPQTLTVGDGDTTLYAQWEPAGAPSGTGTEADPYVIEDSGNLLWLSSMCRDRKSNWSDGKYFLQNNDINLAGINWIPIRNFSGIYDGNGFRIKNMTMSYDRAKADSAGISTQYPVGHPLCSAQYYYTDEEQTTPKYNVYFNRYAFGMFESPGQNIKQIGTVNLYKGAVLKNIHLVGMKVNIDFNTANPDFVIDADYRYNPTNYSTPYVVVGGVVAAAGMGTYFENPYLADDHTNLAITGCTVDETSSISVKAPNAVAGGIIGSAYFKSGDNNAKGFNADNTLTFSCNSNAADITLESKSTATSLKDQSGNIEDLVWNSDITLPCKNVFEPSLTAGGLAGYLSLNSIPLNTSGYGETRGDAFTDSFNSGDITVHAGSTISSGALSYYNSTETYTDPGIADNTKRRMYSANTTYGQYNLDNASVSRSMSGISKVGGLVGYMELANSTYVEITDTGTPPASLSPLEHDRTCDVKNLYNSGTVKIDTGGTGNSPDKLLMAGSFAGEIHRQEMTTLERYGNVVSFANMTDNYFAKDKVSFNGTTKNSVFGYVYQPQDAVSYRINIGGVNDIHYFYPDSTEFKKRLNYIAQNYSPYDQSDTALAGRYEYDNHSFDLQEESWFTTPVTNNLRTSWGTDNWVFTDGKYPQLKLSYFDLESIDIQKYNKDYTSTSIGGKLTLDPYASQDLIAVRAPVGEDIGAVKWTSDDETCVKVSSKKEDKYATITTVSPGTATITALTQKGGIIGTLTVTVTGVDATGIKIVYTQKSGYAGDKVVLDVGESTNPGQLVASVQPTDAYDKAYTWKSSDPDIVSITSDGIAKAEQYGQAYIYAFSHDGSFYDRIKVSAVPLLADSLSIDKTAISLNVTYNSNPTVQITPTLSRTDGKEVTIKRLKWESSDSRIATVSQTGLVYAVGIGTATITATTVDGSKLSKTADVTVTGKHATGVAPKYATDINKELEVGEKVLLPVVVSPEDVLCRDIRWSSSDQSKIKVTSNGWVTPLVSVKAGDVTITATTVDGGFVTSFKPSAVVSETRVGIANKGRFFKMTLGKTRQMITTVYPKNTDFPNVTYSSSNPAVAYVSSNGAVKALSVGMTVITVKSTHKGLTETMVLNVVESSKATVTVKRKGSNSPLSGVSITIDGDTVTTDGNGNANVEFAPDEPETFFEVKKDGYRTIMFTLSELSSGSLTVYMESDNGQPYFEYIGKVSDSGLIGNLGDGYVSSSIKELSTVSAWIDWKNTAKGDVFLSKGSARFRFVPASASYYTIKERCYYDATKTENGLFYANMYPAPTTDDPKPKAAVSKQIAWEFIDLDKQYGDIDMSNSDTNFSDTNQSNMFSTGFDMGLPKNCPVQIEVDGTDVKITVAYKAGLEKGGGKDDSWEKSEDEPGGDVDEMENEELLDSIKDSITSGAMSDKLKQLTYQPNGNKLEKKMEVSVELFGYVEGTLVQKPIFVNVASADQAMADKLGIDPEMMSALKNLGVPSIPLSVVYMQINSGGLQVTGDGRVTYSQQFYPGGIPVYVELVMGASLQQVVKFQIVDNGSMDFSGSTQLKPYMGCYGAVGIGGFLTIGPTLDGQLPITITYPDPVNFDISLAMQFGLRIKVLFWTKNFRFYNRQWTLYNQTYGRSASLQSTGTASLQSIADIDPKLEGFEPLPRDYSSEGYSTNTSENTVMSSVRNVTDVKMTSGYPELMPRLVCLGNGKQLLLWEDDVTTRTLENRTALKYSVSTDSGKNWSEPALIDKDNTADGSYSVAVDGSGNVYVAFQSLAKELDSSASLQDFTGLFQIKVAKYDGTAFTAPVTISNTTTPLAGDYTYEANLLPQVTASGNNVSVVWLCNTANDILGINGDNVIKYVRLDSGSFTKPEALLTTQKSILDYSTIYNGGKLQIAYLSDEDDNLATMTDRSIYLLDEVGGSSSRAMVGEYTDKPTLAYVNGKTSLYWYSSGNIHYMPDIGDTTDIRDVFPASSNLSPATSDFRVMSKNGKSVLLFTEGASVTEKVNGEDKSRPTSNVFAGVYDADQQAWGGFSTNLTQDDKDINYFNGDMDENGALHLAVSQRTVLDESTDTAKLKVYNIEPSVDLAVADGKIYYDESNVVTGGEKLPIAAYVSNNGQLAAKGLTLELYTGNVLVGSQAYPDAVIIPGAKAQRFTVDYTLPTPLAEKDIKLVVKTAAGTTDSYSTNNEASTTVGCGDLRLGKIHDTTAGDAYVADFHVINHSYKKLDNIVAKVYAVDADGNKTGTPVKTISIGSLEAYGETGGTAELKISDIDFAGAYLKTYMLELSTNATKETSTINNYGYFSVLNPNRDMIPFDVSISKVLKDSDSLDFSFNAANLTESANKGDVEFKLYTKPTDDKPEPILLAKKTVSDISLAASDSVEQVVSFDNKDKALDDAYMVTAQFVNGSKGLTNGGKIYYSNLAFNTVEKLIPSSNTNLSEITFEGATVAPKFDNKTSEYTLNPSGDKISFKATAEDDNAALISYSLNSKDKKYLVSGAESDEIAINGGDTLTVTVRAEDGTEKTYKFNAPIPFIENNSPVLVNGKSESVGYQSTEKDDTGGKYAKVTIDNEKLMKQLEKESSGSVVSVTINAASGAAVGELNGQLVKAMENKEAILDVKTGDASYTLPAGQIKISDIAKELGAEDKLSDIKVRVKISDASEQELKLVESSAEKGKFRVVVPAVQFNVTCTYNGKSVEVDSFGAYVERMLAVPSGVDENSITTGIVTEPDGTSRTVPTKITSIDGKLYVVINSLTNSLYSVVSHKVSFTDVQTHWAQEAVDDMGSRMIVSGIGDNKFEPDRDITRAEFAAIVVRALGLKPETGSSQFSDVKESEWFSGYVKTAADNNIINGLGSGKFGPNEKVTREQAMTMIARAMKLTGIGSGLSADETAKQLSAFTDGGTAQNYSKDSIAACVKAGIVTGRPDKTIAPKESMTRAEVATIVRKLLQKSNLI